MASGHAAAPAAVPRCRDHLGLVERRHPGQVKTGRQILFSSDLIYDVLRSTSRTTSCCRPCGVTPCRV